MLAHSHKLARTIIHTRILLKLTWRTESRIWRDSAPLARLSPGFRHGIFVSEKTVLSMTTTTAAAAGASRIEIMTQQHVSFDFHSSRHAINPNNWFMVEMTQEGLQKAFISKGGSAPSTILPYVTWKPFGMKK